MLRSSIDLGTNTCLLLVADWDSSRAEVTRIVSDHARVVRLGQGVDQARKLHPDAKARTLACLRDYAAIVRQAGLDPARTVAVATSQARDAQDGLQFFSEIERETGFRFRTLSGDEEAQGTFRGGLLPGADPTGSVVIDIGGGSTELMALKGGQSLDIGSVRFTERYLKSDPVGPDEVAMAQQAVDAELRKLLPWRRELGPRAQLVGVAGTCTTLAQWLLGLREFDARAVDGTVLGREQVARQVETLRSLPVAERRKLPGVGEGRADVLLAGALILWRSMELLDFQDVRISTRGLRFGVLALQSGA